MKNRIRHIVGGIKGSFVVLFTFILFPFSKLFLLKKEIWIVSEYGYEARDNGYSFFEYIRTNHKEINCYYAIDLNSPDYCKVKKLGNVIKYGSIKHYLFYCGAKYLISSKTQGFCPSYYLTLLRKKIHLWGKYIYLQHGITYNDQKILYKKNSKIDLIICGGYPEYVDIKNRYGYKDKEVAYTGFSRFDNYWNVKKQKQILIMPTWRRGVDNANMVRSEYYRNWKQLFSEELNELFFKNNIIVKFYIHPEFSKFENLFASSYSNIQLVNFADADIQALIKESSLLITDYSSVFFDFAYLSRPIVYYQFDKEYFYNIHYKKGYFDFIRDGFGPIATTYKEVYDYLKQYIDNNFELEDCFLSKSDSFFKLKDNHNSQRIFEAITKI